MNRITPVYATAAVNSRPCPDLAILPIGFENDRARRMALFVYAGRGYGVARAAGAPGLRTGGRRRGYRTKASGRRVVRRVPLRDAMRPPCGAPTLPRHEACTVTRLHARGALSAPLKPRTESSHGRTGRERFTNRQEVYHLLTRHNTTRRANLGAYRAGASAQTDRTAPDHCLGLDGHSPGSYVLEVSGILVPAASCGRIRAPGGRRYFGKATVRIHAR